MKKKYIIDLNPDCVEGEYLRIPARIAGEEQWLVTKAALIPYNAPDLEQVRKEAYEKGCRAGYIKYLNKSYEDGLKDAWEVVKKIALMDTKTAENVTGYFGLFRIMKNLTPMQVIEKLQAYEQEQDEKKKTDYYFEMMKDAIETSAKEYGMSLDEVAAVLEKMRQPAQ